MSLLITCQSTKMPIIMPLCCIPSPIEWKVNKIMCMHERRKAYSYFYLHIINSIAIESVENYFQKVLINSRYCAHRESWYYKWMTINNYIHWNEVSYSYTDFVENLVFVETTYCLLHRWWVPTYNSSPVSFKIMRTSFRFNFYFYHLVRHR